MRAQGTGIGRTNMFVQGRFIPELSRRNASVCPVSAHNASRCASAAAAACSSTTRAPKPHGSKCTLGTRDFASIRAFTQCTNPGQSTLRQEDWGTLLLRKMPTKNGWLATKSFGSRIALKGTSIFAVWATIISASIPEQSNIGSQLAIRQWYYSSTAESASLERGCGTHKEARYPPFSSIRAHVCRGACG